MRLFPLEWTPASRPLARLDGELLGWQGTPYGSGQGVKQGAADCIGSVFGIIDSLDGVTRERDSLPADVALHARDTAIGAMKKLMRVYGPSKITDGRVQPGDLLVVGQANGGPGHVLIVGTQRNTLWDSQPLVGFQRRGWALDASQVFHAAFRPDKSKW
jgi:hypothetical protein